MAEERKVLVVVKCRARILELIAEGIRSEQEISEKLSKELPSLCEKCKVTPHPDLCLIFPPPGRSRFRG